MSLAITIGRLFAPTVLTTSAVTMYTCPATPSTNVLVNGRVRCANTTSGPVTVTLYAVPLAGTAAVGNCIAYQESISAYNHQDFDVPQLAAGDFLQALASAGTSVTITALAGTLITQ